MAAEQRLELRYYAANDVPKAFSTRVRVGFRIADEPSIGLRFVTFDLRPITAFPVADIRFNQAGDVDNR